MLDHKASLNKLNNIKITSYLFQSVWYQTTMTKRKLENSQKHGDKQHTTV